MKPCRGKLSLKKLYLEYPAYESKSLRLILLHNYDDFFSYIMKMGLSVTSHEKVVKNHSSSSIEVTLPTTCFKVEFNDSFVTISPIKKE